MGAGSSSSSSSSAAPSSSPPNARATLFRPRPFLRYAFGSEKVLLWELYDHTGSHSVRLEHDIFTGRRLIAVDDRVVFSKPRTLIDTGSTHQFDIGIMHCQISIFEQGMQYGYALTINGKTFAQFRDEFWQTTALWYLPVKHTTDEAASSTRVHFHRVLVLSYPQLTVLVNGRVVDLQSAFSSSAPVDTVSDQESTTHTFFVSTRPDNTIADVEEEGEESGGSGGAAGRAAAVAPSAASDADLVPCELMVWLAQSESSSTPGQVSAARRDKRHQSFRYTLRCGGQVMAQASSPIGVRGGATATLQNAAANTNAAPITDGKTPTAGAGATPAQNGAASDASSQPQLESDFGMMSAQIDDGKTKTPAE